MNTAIRTFEKVLFKDWFHMNKYSYQLFFENRENNNLSKEENYHVVHHTLEKEKGNEIKDNFSETYILINKELSYLHFKDNLMIMDDYMHTVIHMFINKFSNKPINTGASSILFNEKTEKESIRIKKDYLKQNYTEQEIELLKEILKIQGASYVKDNRIIKRKFSNAKNFKK